jgi:hypothetical protein
VNLQLVALTGAGEFTYSNGIPAEATQQIDPTATPFGFIHAARLVVWEGAGAQFSHRSRSAAPTVFIKGMTFPDFLSGGKFQVVSKVPHLAVRINGGKENHRVQLVGSVEIQPIPDISTSRQYDTWFQHNDIYLFPIDKTCGGSDTNLTFIVQRSRTAIFTIRRP